MSPMDELRMSRSQREAVLGAYRSIVEARGSATGAGAHLLEVVAGALELGSWRDVPAASAEQVAAQLQEPQARRILADTLVIPACIEGVVSAEGEAVARGIASALGVRSHWVDLLGAMRRGSVLAVKRRLVASSPDAKRIFERTWSEEGVRGLWQMFTFVIGAHRDPELAARFRALGQLAEGTLGRAFHDHLASRGLAFPGERGGMPERMVHHDLMHVVNGYGTDPAGECEIAGLYAGMGRGDWMTFLVTALTTFQLAMPVSPAVVTPARGAFDPARVLAAFLRGRRLRVDVMGPWDYWALMPLRIEEARAQLGLEG